MATTYGRHVLLTFDSTADAEEFIAAFKVEGAVFYQDVGGHFKNVDIASTKVLGLYGKPNQFCECPWSDGEKKYVRGTKYGLMVHDKCAKPEGGHLQTAAKNLLDPPGLGAKETVEQPNYARLSTREGEHNWPKTKHEKEAE